ncbi:metal ABC transporter ATP-binding protein [Candidatus Gromoviella agglomerans]|uniref:metal ABC transporter ATP-binding protein n=1 Tax=Candidatus Gromoviella agglomerans TaxID=2806609 RepID=UPI001E5AF7C4|nr:metal ABC transporter ATP-binding protein [Candidatus Gromoviella agglomerans]UFX98533.1 ZnuABC transporter family protein [Candidatus Gromoviella agglomerans]
MSLKISNLSVSKDSSFWRKKNFILHNISFDLAKGEILTIIGPNGGGKTTLIKTILGLRDSFTGHIESNFNTIGYVPQRVSTNNKIPLSVEEFLNLAPNRFMQITEVLDIVNCPHLKDNCVLNLSTGEFQKILFARAIIRKPDLIVLDEVTQGMDLHSQLYFFDLISHINKLWNTSVMLISHDMQNVMAKSHKIICLNREICCMGSPCEVHSDIFLQMGHYHHKHF